MHPTLNFEPVTQVPKFTNGFGQDNEDTDDETFPNIMGKRRIGLTAKKTFP